MPEVGEIHTRLDVIEASVNVIRSLALPGASPRQREMMAIAATEISFQAHHIAESLEPAEPKPTEDKES